MVNAQRILWAIGVALLVAPTVWLIYIVYFTPPSYIGTAKMMVAGKLVVSTSPEAAHTPAPQTSHVAVDRDDIIAIVALVAIYLPGITLLLVAAFRTRRLRAATPTI